jgi:hypothetical protein
MSSDDPDANERLARIALMMQQYGWAKQRRLMKQAMTVWRRKETRAKPGKRLSPPVRIH